MTARGRISALALSLVAVAALPTAEAPAKATSARSCAHRGSTTVASTATGRVYRVKVANGGDDGTTLDNVFGCWRSNGRRTRLATEYDDDYVLSGTLSLVKLSGRFAVTLFVADDVSCKADCPPDYDPSTATLEVTNLKTGKAKVLDRGDVADTSVKVGTSRVSWTNGGTRKSASLK